MAVLKITNLKNMVKDGVEISNMGIEIKKYLPFMQKRALIEAIALASLIDENGIVYEDKVLLNGFYEIEMLKAYSNINFAHIKDDDPNRVKKTFDYYDYLKEHGIVDYVLDNIPEQERETISQGIKHKIQSDIEISRQTIVFIDRWIKALIDKLPSKEDLKKVADMIEQSDTKDLKVLGDDNG